MCTVIGSYRHHRGRVSSVPKQHSPKEAQMFQVMESPSSGDTVWSGQAEVRGAVESGEGA